MSRKNIDALGTVVDVEECTVKVKWDGGRTSYYRPNAQGNVKLKGPKQP